MPFLIFLVCVGIISATILWGINYYMDMRIQSLYILVAATLIAAGVGFLRRDDTETRRVTDEKTLLVGTSADFAPFSYMQNGVIAGFDIELITEVARRLDKTLALQNMPFGTLIPSLQLGTIHVIAAGLTATPERAQHVLFTDTYLENDPLVIVSRTENPVSSLGDLVHKTVIVNQGYTADTYISKLSDITILRLPTPADAFLALTSKRADAFVAARKTLQVFFDQHPHVQFTVVEIPDAQENCALAIAPKYAQLRDEIQSVLHTMKQDGTLEQLRKKWNV